MTILPNNCSSSENSTIFAPQGLQSIFFTCKKLPLSNIRHFRGRSTGAGLPNEFNLEEMFMRRFVPSILIFKPC